MNLEQMLTELRELMAKLTEYRALDAEARTEEVRTEQETRMARIKQLEADIREEKEAIELEERMNATINAPDGGDGGSPNFTTTTVEDQPIYRGNNALAVQCLDIVSVQTGRANVTESRERIEKNEKRERELRAAGVGMVEAVAVDGGMLLQGESTVDLMTNGWNNSALLSRTDNINIGGSFWDEIGIDETSRATGSRGGGVRVYNDSELAEITSSKTKLKKTRWEPERLTGLVYLSNEIDSDVPALQSELSTLFGEEFAFKMQDAVVEGSGVGEALGYKESGAIIPVPKESGQVAATIVYKNLLKMLARVHLSKLDNLAWYINQDCLEQLYTLTIAVGTGGSTVSAWMPNLSGAPGVLGTLLGYPVIPIEQAETLGTLGDITLANLSGYRTVNKGGVESAISAHVKFELNQLALRFVTRFGGQPKNQLPLTPFKGTKTVSHFVNLATRS